MVAKQPFQKTLPLDEATGIAWKLERSLDLLLHLLVWMFLHLCVVGRGAVWQETNLTLILLMFALLSLTRVDPDSQ